MTRCSLIVPLHPLATAAPPDVAALRARVAFATATSTAAVAGAATAAAPDVVAGADRSTCPSTIAEILLVLATSECTTAMAAAHTAIARVAAAGDTPVRWLPPAAQRGVAAACNAGAAAATQPYVMFLAPDVQPHAGWLAALLALARHDPRAAIVGGKLLASADAVYHAGIAVDQHGWPRRIYAGLPANHPAVNTTRRMQMVSGASMLVRRDAFEKAGGFDAAFAAEDAAFDLCLRLGERGYDVHYCHDSVATCPPGGPRASESPALRMRSTRLFRTRWIHKLRPDDVTYYQADRLLQVRYDDAAPAQVIVAPPLATASIDAYTDAIAAERQEAHRTSTVATGTIAAIANANAHAAERVLAARGHQVRVLLEENARLMERVAGLEVASRACAAAANAASAATLGTAGMAGTAAPKTITSQAAVAEMAPDPDANADDLMPPPELALSVGGEFRETGEEFLTYFVEIGGLRPTDRVLDVGCGVGRMAVPLTRYLTGDGGYEGFDVMADAIAWCQRHITPRFPAFRFAHVPLRSQVYNAAATTAPTAFAFPYPASSFDFVFLTSVFTHLLPADAQHYLAQIARVLKPRGRCFSTFFLLNPESTGLIQAGLSPHFPFAHRVDDGCRVQDPVTPEAAVAYDEDRVRGWYRDAGLDVIDPIRDGFWCGRLDGLSLQDIVLATKA
jgi:SAM-dependent methyltransferase